MELTQLIQKKIPAEYLSLIEKVRGLADKNNQGAALVGGIVRDLILDRNILDVDVVLEPPAEPLVKTLAETLKAKIVSHEKFLTFTLHVGTQSRLDIATAREESYPEPGKLPVVRPSDLGNDLKRRDFSINAIAVWLNKNKFGTLLDPFSGVSDIKKKIIRVLHDKSFEDDPTRIFRAARFAGRFGFLLDNKTERLLFKAIAEKRPALLSPVRLRHEFELILKEENPLESLRLLDKWRALYFIHPEWVLLLEHIETMGKISDSKNRLVDRLKIWFKPWGTEKAAEMMKALAFEKEVKRKVIG